MNLNTTMNIREICAIVPTYNPDQKFLTVVRQLIDSGFEHILIVNDGSKEESGIFFDEAAAYPQCTVISHYRNLGKGRALKTAFNYCLKHFPRLTGAVTVDADNQHEIGDIVHCAERLLRHPDALVLGVRNFRSPNVPKKNRLGNLITVWVFRVLCGIRVSDTQTGLRAMSNKLMNLFLDLDGERFEYETNMLIETRRKLIPIEEVVIQTVYIEGNESSHFNPFTDSIRIYLLIFLSASIVSFLIDLTVFTIMMAVLSSYTLEVRIAAATVAARLTSSFINYSMNRKFVFQAANPISNSIRKYYILAVFQALVSMGGVYALTRLIGINSTVIKAFVDFVLFFLSFQIQREWVFVKKTDGRDGENENDHGIKTGIK